MSCLDLAGEEDVPRLLFHLRREAVCEEGDDVVDGDGVKCLQLRRVAAAEHLLDRGQEWLLDRLQPNDTTLFNFILFIYYFSAYYYSLCKETFKILPIYIFIYYTYIMYLFTYLIIIIIIIIWTVSLILLLAF